MSLLAKVPKGEHLSGVCWVAEPFLTTCFSNLFSFILNPFARSGFILEPFARSGVILEPFECERFENGTTKTQACPPALGVTFRVGLSKSSELSTTRMFTGLTYRSRLVCFRSR